MPQTSSTAHISWEYLMPKRKERMAGYIRESDPSLADSTTIDSAAQAVREYAKQQGYIYEPQHEYKEAISAYTVPYLEREKLVALLEAARRREFDRRNIGDRPDRPMITRYPLRINKREWPGYDRYCEPPADQSARSLGQVRAD